MVATIAVVVGFQNSSNVASAYGVALTATMLITTLLAFVVTRRLWGWTLWLSVAVTGVFLVGDIVLLRVDDRQALRGRLVSAGGRARWCSRS